MASTINSTSVGSGGLVSTGDDSGQLELQTDGTTRVTINSSGNATFAGDVSVTGSLSTTGGIPTPLVVKGNSTAGSEIRLPEDTDNGSNYVALKAANSIASNVTFTLPNADGTSGQVLKTDASGGLSFGNVATANGGTGLTSFTTNGAVYATSTSALTTGTLPVASGGTGATTLTANNVLLGNGTSAIQTVAPGTSGNVLTSNGTTWTSSAPSGATTGKLLASVNFNASGIAALSWADTGVKRLQVMVVMTHSSNGSMSFSIGHTATVVTTSNYNYYNWRTSTNTNGSNTLTSQPYWGFGGVSTTGSPQIATIDIGLGSDGLPYGTGQMTAPASSDRVTFGGYFTGTWTTAQFRSITVSDSASSGFGGRVTVIGYTE